MSPTIQFHPFANMFPLLSAADGDLLKQSLKETGQLDAIVLLEGMILEGRNRYLQLVSLGVEPVFDDYDTSIHGPSPLEYVWAKNYIRRHLSASQRSVVAAEYAKAKSEASGGKGKTEAVNAAAAQMHVAPSQVHNAAKLQHEAPDLFEEVKAGEKTVHGAMVELEKRDHSEDQTVNAGTHAGALPNVLEFPVTAATTHQSGSPQPVATTGPPAQSAPAQLDATPPDGKPAKKKTASKSKKKGGASAPEPESKDATEMKELRKNNSETVTHLHGEEFGKAFKGGMILKSLKELKAFLKCNDNEQALIVPYVAIGWDVARASKFVIRSIDLKDPIQDLIFRFNATGKKSETFTIQGFTITVKKS